MAEPRRILVHFATLLAGSIIGLWFAFSVERSETEIVHGFPLPWAAWQKVGDRWLDFVGPFSPFLFGIDLLIGIGGAYLTVKLLRLIYGRLSKGNAVQR